MPVPSPSTLGAGGPAAKTLPQLHLQIPPNTEPGSGFKGRPTVWGRGGGKAGSGVQTSDLSFPTLTVSRLHSLPPRQAEQGPRVQTSGNPSELPTQEPRAPPIQLWPGHTPPVPQMHTSHHQQGHIPPTGPNSQMDLRALARTHTHTCLHSPLSPPIAGLCTTAADPPVSNTPLPPAQSPGDTYGQGHPQSAGCSQDSTNGGKAPQRHFPCI